MSYVYEVTAPFDTPEIELKVCDLIIWNPKEVSALQKRQGRLREIPLPPHFGAHLMGYEGRLCQRPSIHLPHAVALAAGGEQQPPAPPRRLSAPRHLVALK